MMVILVGLDWGSQSDFRVCPPEAVRCIDNEQTTGSEDSRHLRDVRIDFNVVAEQLHRNDSVKTSIAEWQSGSLSDEKRHAWPL